MELEVQTVDVLVDMLNDFETHYNQLVEDSKTEFNAFFSAVREAENQYSEATTQHAMKLLDEYAAGQQENSGLTDEVLRLLQDKDILLQAVQASHDAHTTHIDSLEDKRVQAELARFHKLQADFKVGPGAGESGRRGGGKRTARGRVQAEPFLFFRCVLLSAASPLY